MRLHYMANVQKGKLPENLKLGKQNQLKHVISLINCTKSSATVSKGRENNQKMFFFVTSWQKVQENNFIKYGQYMTSRNFGLKQLIFFRDNQEF